VKGSCTLTRRPAGRVVPQVGVEPLAHGGVFEFGAAGVDLVGVGIGDVPALHVGDIGVEFPATDEEVTHGIDAIGKTAAFAEGQFPDAGEVELARNIDLVGRLLFELRAAGFGEIKVLNVAEADLFEGLGAWRSWPGR
jgi:hypothetical protein